MLFTLASKSLWNRKVSVGLTLLGIVVSVTLLLSIEQIRQQTRDGFTRSVSGVDLIVGARTSSTNLLLGSVFHLSSLPSGIRWQTYQDLAQQKAVKWAIPIALGDSHDGFAVVGTTPSYFEHFRYADKQALQFSQGLAFSESLEVVLGADVALHHQYNLGDTISLSHGTAKVSFSVHRDNPFKVVGILARTGTPVDTSLYIALKDLSLIHNLSHADHQSPVDAVSAVMLGLSSPLSVLTMQRFITQYDGEPLTAILPGVALNELWSMLTLFENTLLVISSLVFVSAMIAMAIMLLASVRERKQEIRVLRMLGAGPSYVFALIQLEALLVTGLGIALSLMAMWLASFVLSGYLNQEFGLMLNQNYIDSGTISMAIKVLISASVVACIPAVSGYLKARL